MNPTRRERIREATYEEIRSVAWKQVAELGVPALSLRAIAREMGMTAPGLYRYFPSRDDLVTALIIEAFDSFSQTLESARDACPADAHAVRYRAVCEAYFGWAMSAPARYTLIFGSPVPGYQMGEAAYPSAQRSFLVLQAVIGEALRAGRIQPQADTIPLSKELLARYATLQDFGMPYDSTATHLALTTWSTLHGITALHLYGYLGMFLAEQVQAFVQQEIEQLMRSLSFVENSSGG
jgi:AcrR family transcriptional regulator